MKALILVDIQNDFLPGGSLPVPSGNEIIPVVNQIQPHFDLIVATQDWHPADHKSFASNHKNKKIFDVITWQEMPQVLWPDHCIQGTYGAMLAETVNWNNVEAIIRKGTNPQIDSYSGFYDNGHLKSTGLADFLQGRQINKIYLAGLAADYCVSFTAKDGLKKGFETYIIEDATKAISKENFEIARKELVELGANFIKSSELGSY